MYPHSPFAHPISSFNKPVPILDENPDTGNLVSVCLNEHWIPLVLGALQQLLLQSTWDTSDPAVLAIQQGRVFDLMELFGMSTSCCDIRIVDGVFEVTSDGGATWTPVAASSPGTSGHDPQTYEPLRPARTGANIQCLAAANAVACLVELHREIVKWWNDAAVVLVFCGVIAAILGVFFPIFWSTFAYTVNWLTIVNQILNYTDALTDAAFTADIKEVLTCILLTYVDAQGRWDETAMTDILSDIAAQSGSMWSLLHIYVSQIGGYAGLNNAGVTTSVATYDCSGCAGWCYVFDFSEPVLAVASETEWPPSTVLGDPAAHYQFSGAKPALGTGYHMSHTPVGVMCEFDAIHVDILHVYAQKYGSTTFGDLRVYGKEIDNSWGIINYSVLDSSVDIEVHRPLKGFAIIVYADYELKLSDVWVNGLGTNPFGDDNCT